MRWLVHKLVVGLLEEFRDLVFIQDLVFVDIAFIKDLFEWRKSSIEHFVDLVESYFCLFVIQMRVVGVKVVHAHHLTGLSMEVRTVVVAASVHFQNVGLLEEFCDLVLVQLLVFVDVAFIKDLFERRKNSTEHTVGLVVTIFRLVEIQVRVVGIKVVPGHQITGP